MANLASVETPAFRDLDGLRRSCGYCAMREICLPAGLVGADLEKVDAVVRDKFPLERGQTLFRQGAAFTALYVVRAGSLKTYVDGADGEVQILGFHLPGEIVGIGGLHANRYPSTAEALERAKVCELPYQQLHAVGRSVPALQHQLVRSISHQVVAEQEHAIVMGKQQAQRRLAIFLRNLADRYARLSRDPELLTLPMSRSDIANYLGLVIETVSRLFSRMEADGILTVKRKSVRILSRRRLDELCGDEVPSEPVPVGIAPG